MKTRRTSLPRSLLLLALNVLCPRNLRLWPLTGFLQGCRSV